MKILSLFRSKTPNRFEIKPRYWDPVKEEIEQRTAFIKRELEAQGKLTPEEIDIKAKYETGIRGAFSKNRKSKSFASGSDGSTALIRTFIFLILLGGGGGYIFLGPIIFQYMLIIAALLGVIYFISKRKPKRKDE
ncbi:MAG: hypothetical protein PSV36_13480 [Algoriphagus sp.]|nr:hypothetical protein [Algoriphagus sp.]